VGLVRVVAQAQQPLVIMLALSEHVLLEAQRSW